MKRIGKIALFIFIPFLGMSQSLEELNKPTISALDEVSPFYEGFAAVRKGNQWGFIDESGKLVIDIRNDLVSNNNVDTSKDGISAIGHPQFKEGLCLIKELTEEGIPRYGFMDTTGKIVIKPEFLNATQFESGYAVAIYERSSLRGKNEFQLQIYDYDFTEVILNKAGEMIWPVQERQNIIMSKNKYQLPELHTKILAQDLLAVKGRDNLWKIVKTKMNNSGSK